MGVNDGCIVQIAGVCRHRPLWSLHMLAPAALPTLEKNSLSHTLQWNNLPAQGNLHWSWADPHSRARPLKFWPLRLLGDTVSHCEFFFLSPIGCIPSVRKCVTALQKQHLSEITPHYASVIHLCSLSYTRKTYYSQTGIQCSLTSLKSSGSSALGLYFGDTGVKGDLTFDPLSC